MKKLNWIEIKRDLVRQENGEYIIEKITEERNLKKTPPIDLIFKGIGSLAIFIPLFLFYFQYRHEIKKKRNENLAELYTNIASDVEGVINLPYQSEGFHLSYENLDFKYSAKIALFQDDSLSKGYTNILLYNKIYKSLKGMVFLDDSVLQGHKRLYEDCTEWFTWDKEKKAMGKHTISFINSNLRKSEECNKLINDIENLEIEAKKNSYTLVRLIKQFSDPMIGTYNIENNLDSLLRNVGVLKDEILLLKSYLLKKSDVYLERFHAFGDKQYLIGFQNSFKISTESLTKSEIKLLFARRNFEVQVLRLLK